MENLRKFLKQSSVLRINQGQEIIGQEATQSMGLDTKKKLKRKLGQKQRDVIAYRDSSSCILQEEELGVDQDLTQLLIWLTNTQQYFVFQPVCFHQMMTMWSLPLTIRNFCSMTQFRMLALNVLIENADCVLPVDNQALFDIVSKVDSKY